MSILLQRTGFVIYTPDDICPDADSLLNNFVDMILTSIGLDHYDSAGTRRRSILRFRCEKGVYSLINPQLINGVNYYAYSLTEKLNPTEQGRIRRFHAVTNDSNGVALCDNPYIRAHASFLMGLCERADVFEFDYQFICYSPTEDHPSHVTPPTIHFDGLDSYTLSSITTLSRKNIVGGEFIVAKGSAVGVGVDNVASGDIYFLSSILPGWGLVLDERSRNGGLPVAHGAKATHLANPSLGEGHRLIMVVEVKPIW